MARDHLHLGSNIGLFSFLVTFLGLVVGFTASAETQCRSVDLRRPELNQPQVQVFRDAHGKLSDSGMCASFSAALMVSQQIGVSINPVDYAFKSVMGIVSRLDKSLSFQHQGLCAQATVNAFLSENKDSFVQNFNDFVIQISPVSDASSFGQMDNTRLEEASKWLRSVCNRRLSEPPLQHFGIQLRVEGAELAEFLMPEGYSLMSKSEMGEEVDRLLDQGNFVQYTHSGHAVTIVGRTADCRYIIQDSIPEYAWNEFGAVLEPGDVYKDAASANKDLARIQFEKEVIQYWPRDILIKNAMGIGYVKRGEL